MLLKKLFLAQTKIRNNKKKDKEEEQDSIHRDCRKFNS